MSVANKAVTSFAGGLLFSGGPRTGEMPHIRGGSVMASVFSGGILQINSGSFHPIVQNGDQGVFWSGAGRLNWAMAHQSTFALSGPTISFYDSAVPAQSGPGTYQQSGARLLGIINTTNGQSGQIDLPSNPYYFEMPFTSGLAANFPSGCPGCSFTWTPQVVPLPGQ